MSLTYIGAAILVFAAVSQAHWAGAGYVLAVQQNKRPIWAIVRSIAALGLAAYALWMMRAP